MEDIVAEAKQLEALGVRELTIVAQDTTRYGLDIYGKYALAELLHKITDRCPVRLLQPDFQHPAG